jgi:hypothetical protein
MSERDLILEFTDRELEPEHRLNSEAQNQHQFKLDAISSAFKFDARFVSEFFR